MEEEAFGMTKNLGIKILSLAFAIMLWFFVVGEEKAEITISIPVELVNIPSNLVVANDIPSAIDVRVYGPRSLIRAVATQGISRVIDLKGSIPGKLLVHITPDSIPLPTGIRVLRINPQNIEIVLDHVLRKRVLVKPVIIGKPNKDFKVVSTIVTPSELVVVGPEKELKDLKVLKTLPVDIEGATSTIEQTVALDLDNLHISPVDTGSVKVIVKIAPVSGERRITHIPVLARGNKKFRFWPKVVSAILKGPKVGLRRLEPRDILVEIDSRTLEPGRHKVLPEITVPKGYTLKKMIPEKITVTVSGNKTSEQRSKMP